MCPGNSKFWTQGIFVLAATTLFSLCHTGMSHNPHRHPYHHHRHHYLPSIEISTSHEFYDERNGLDRIKTTVNHDVYKRSKRYTEYMGYSMLKPMAVVHIQPAISTPTRRKCSRCRLVYKSCPPPPTIVLPGNNKYRDLAKKWKGLIYGCQCSTIGSISTACDIVTGQCKCKSNVVGRQCNQCEVGYWGIATGTGCVTCNCNAVGSLNMSCDYDTGQCQCRPGVGGKRCDTCQPGYYGFSQNGCQICDPCEKLGHICDQDTGRCVCPRLTFGEHCDRCRPDSYGLMLGIGCKACLCGSGSTKSQCDMNGQCSCRTGFTGLKCDQCASGYYGYPRCKSCSCHGDGTVNCQDGICHCDHNGQCPCKENAIGRQCDECTTGTFGLDKNNPKGCTECFCFNRSTMCHQANLSWSQWRLPRPRALFINESINDILITNFGFSTSLSPSIGGLNVTNGLFIIPEDQGDIILPENLYFNYPLYWKLPSTFLGDKVVSYGGWLKFKIATNGGIALKTSLSYPLVQIQGNNKIILEYYQPLTVTDEQYKIRLHESLWQIQNRPDYRVSREVFMVALQNIQYILIKSSDFSDFEDVKLLEASIDAAVLKPTHSLALAMGIEICECPAEYNGTSCQDPSTGYYRWHNNKTITSTSVIGLVGEARLCQCNGRSEICDIETGYCLHCKFNTAGKHCDVCAESFYGHPDHGGCKPCPCPYTDKRFSNSCIVKDNDEVICHCKPGYSGPRCERCSYGFYGYPNISGGICTPCNCNPAGSASDECDEETGQCNCKFGSTGRDCSQCTSLRHVFINNVCTSCNDNCTGFLLNDLDKISLHLATETVHIAEGYIPPPWIKLTSINKSSNEFFDEITRLGHLKHRFKNIPWLDLKILMETFEELFKNAANSLGRAWDVKPKAEDIKNNIFNINVEIKNLRDLLDAITAQLTQYGDEVKKVGVKKSLKDALAILHYLKSVNFSQKYQQCQNDLDEATDYIEWLNSQLEIIQPLDKIKLKAAQYSRKLDDLKLYIQRTMETLFTYDSLFNKINNTYGGVKYQSDNINIINADTLGMIDEGIKLNEEAKIFIIDSNNNFENFQDLKTKLEDGTKKLQEKEGIAYRLNNEYREKYVDKANQHARKLSDYMNRYVALFVRTRNEASNPLKASQAYKNIVDSLAAARFSATRATSAAWESYYKIYPGGSQTKSLLDRATEMSEECTAQLENSQSLAIPLGSLQNKWHTQKHAVLDVKNSLNSTGIKDNLINMKLRELKSGCERRKDRIVEVKLDHQILIDSVLLSEKLINDYKEGIASGLRPQLHELKREGDSKISLASEKLTEAQSYIKKADAKLISLSHAAEKRQIEFGRWNRTLAEKLNKLKNKISEARNTADGIRISLKSVEGKKCFRSYRLKTIQPSTTTSIVMTLALTNHRTEGALFYLASGINDDFVALELFEGKIRFLWNVGGGTGVVTHPEILESGDPQTDNNWYRIQAERIRNTATLSIQKEVSASEKYLTVTNSTNPEFGRFDVTNGDRIWLGGMPTTQRRPAELMAQNGLPGCIHHVIFDHKHIGIWNFFTTAPDKSCKACVEGAEKAKNDIAYSFNGEGYAVRNRISSGPYNKYTFGVSINFKTFDENALIFLAINPENNQYIMIYLREGYIILHISYGGNISIEMSSKFKYNNGNWTQVDAFRQYQLKKNIEKCSLSVNGENDKKIGAPTPQPTKEDIPDLAQTKYYIGGVPPSFDSNNLILPSEISFLGCMSNINIQEGYDPMAEQYYGVEAACTNRPLKVVGFYGDGYLEYRSFTFKKISSIINFSFRSTQEEAALLLSTFEGQNNRYQNLENYDETTKNIYYSVAIVHGQIHVRLNAGSGELILQSNNTYNDGKYHIVSISKRRKEIELRVDDAYQASGKLPSSVSIKAPEFGGLYFGGLPAFLNNTKLIGSVLPLYGAIRDAIFNDDILRFDEAVSFNRALIGRAGPNIGKDVPTYIPSASLSRSLSSQPEGCQKVPYYSLEPGALKFGDKSHSHTQLYLNFKKFWEKKFVIEFDFRTYYPNGLLFITPGIKRKHYLMVIIRDSQLVLMVKSKQKKEILFKTPFNDGNWHRINIDHDGRKLTMVVDSQTPRTIKVPKKIGLESMMYIGGMPESGTPFPDQVVAKLETLKGCIRGLRVNGNIYDMVGSTSRAVSVGQCFSDVESGAYFQDDAYAIYKRNFELGAVLELQLEFRTSELSGVLLSITATNESPSLSLEINNGKVVMSRDLGDKSPLSVEQQFMSPYTVCDNQWHRIHAIFNNEELALKVDDLDQKYGLPANIDDHLMASTTSSSLYIGGLPAAAPKGTLVTRDHFNGCIRNVMIDTERRDWTDMAELHNVHLCSCPIQ